MITCFSKKLRDIIYRLGIGIMSGEILSNIFITFNLNILNLQAENCPKYFLNQHENFFGLSIIGEQPIPIEFARILENPFRFFLVRDTSPPFFRFAGTIRPNAKFTSSLPQVRKIGFDRI